jgi:hypothetical protein
MDITLSGYAYEGSDILMTILNVSIVNDSLFERYACTYNPGPY